MLLDYPIILLKNFNKIIGFLKIFRILLYANLPLVEAITKAA